MGTTTSAGGRGGLRIVSSSDEELILRLRVERCAISPSTALPGFERVSLPAFALQGDPGEPALPVARFLVALPPGASYQLSYEVIAREKLGLHRLEPVPFPVLLPGEGGGVGQKFRFVPATYRGFKAPQVVWAGKSATLRGQAVLPLFVSPLRYDPTSGELEQIEDIRITVRFLAGGVGAPPSLPPRLSPEWRRILGSALLNAKQALRWQKSARARRPMPSPVRPLSPAQPAVKLRVKETGLYRVSASVLAAEGFPLGRSVGSIHLFRRYYDRSSFAETAIDVPFTVVEDSLGIAGIFDAADQLVFYGLGLRDDPLSGDPSAKFSDYNVYWLAPEPGTEMGTLSLRKGYLSPDTASVSFPATLSVHKDNLFWEPTPPPLTDFYYYNYPNLASISLPLRVGWPLPNATASVRLELLGADDDKQLREVKVSLRNRSGTYLLGSVNVPNKDKVIYNSPSFPSSYLVPGENDILLEPGAGRGALEVLVNWYSLAYRSRFKAMGNRLAFSTGSLHGDTTLTVLGLTRRDLYLFDVTENYNPAYARLPDSLFAWTGSDYAFSFRPSLSSSRSYILTSLDSIRVLGQSDVAADSPSRLIGGSFESGVDVLVVCHRDFVPQMSDWAAYRTAQGYRVLLADVEDVYDEFNGGVAGADAIRNFVRHFYFRAGASFLVLVGDASEDSKRVHSDSGINFVPTQSYPEHIDTYPFFEDEVVTTDKWYVQMEGHVNRGDYDSYPDLIVGRLPVGSSQEMQTLLDKTVAYEHPQGDQSWRKRMIMVADDAWSFADIGSGACYQPGEENFRRGEEAAAAVIDSFLLGGYDIVRFYLAPYTDQIHPSSGCMGSDEITKLMNFTRATATPELIGQLNQGATLVSVQAHTNRYQICHEYLFTSSFVFGIRDHRRLLNYGKPFVLLGMGCHMSDYALHRELLRHVYNDVNGDCLSELLLLLRNRGAVATYGSTGFEYLGENKYYTRMIYRTFFDYPPVDTMSSSGKAQARWIFGEVMTAAEVSWANVGQIKRYHILGDPLLRIDAGPPRFQVTVNGRPYTSGQVVRGVDGDSIVVAAVVTDENAIDKLKVEVDGVDVTDSVSIDTLLDRGLSASRRYRVSFAHELMTRPYDIILWAYQLPDTSGTFQMVSDFILSIRPEVELRVGGRLVASGDAVPKKGDYRLSLRFAAAIGAGDLSLAMDGDPVTDAQYETPESGDSSSWVVSFHRDLPPGEHLLSVSAKGDEIASYQLRVNNRLGLDQVIAFPNPFQDETYFVFSNDVAIEKGAVEVFTTSGRKVAHIDIPPSARMPGQNAVHWDGEDLTGSPIANGVYLFVVTVDQEGKRIVARGKLAKIE